MSERADEKRTHGQQLGAARTPARPTSGAGGTVEAGNGNGNGGDGCPPCLRGGGEMGALMRATDWSKTRFGPIERWPQSLKTMLGVVLGSRFPMLMWWGPDLLHLYNDAYRPILREKHPASLAAPAAEIWAEVWDVAGPMARGVLAGGPATWTKDLQLFITSGAMAEETYFTFSYSPVPGDDGMVGGLLNTVQETTATVQGERQFRLLHDLGRSAAEARTEVEAYRAAATVLAGNPLDVPFALIYRADEAGHEAELLADCGWGSYQGPGRPERIELGVLREDGARWPVESALREGREILVDSLEARFGSLPIGRWGGRAERALILPLGQATQGGTRATLVMGISPHRMLDERYRLLLDAIADQIASGVAGARAFEAETRRAEALLEVDRAKTIFFSNISHEFRTPLTLILGPLEDAITKRGTLQGAPLEAVNRNAVRLMRLVNSLLDFARIESGRMEVSFAPTDLASLTAEIASSFRSLIERVGIRFVVDCEPLPEAIHVDGGQWEKIVLNLLSNAFKFTSAGEISVALRWRATHVELTVTDTGCGIPEHELPRMFERFHRVEGASGRSFEGTGIGLSLVQEFVGLHGGTVSVSSRSGEDGAGSSFRVAIPTGTAHLAPERIGSARHPTQPGLGSDRNAVTVEAASWTIAAGPDAALRARPERMPQDSQDAAGVQDQPEVLIVDDNADMRDYLARIIGEHWRVRTAGDGAQALAAARDRIPDLVLSDVMMPVMDGVALLRELRAQRATREVPVVLISARAGEEAVVAGIETGADDYLVKPFSARELVARVRTHLDMALLRRAWSRELEHANAELEAFSYSVSHDLRTPLRAIEGFAAVLEENAAAKLSADDLHCIERVRAATRRMESLIEGLLDLARINRAVLRRERVDITALARATLAERAEHDPARVVDAMVAEGLLVHGDPRMLGALVENLIGNAWKYSGTRARARIEVGRSGVGSEEGFFVRDNGVGFDASQSERLFKPFQRLHAGFDGLGIGLATVFRIANRHGGRVWADGERDQGATFHVTLGRHA